MFIINLIPEFKLEDRSMWLQKEVLLHILGWTIAIVSAMIMMVAATSLQAALLQAGILLGVWSIS